MIRTATLTGVQDDENPYTIQTPPRTEYKDLNASVKLPVVTMDAVDTYMAPLCVKLEDKAKNLYKERFLIYVRSAAKNNKYHLLAPCATNMKKSVSYCVDVIVDNEGVIDECQCECAVGTGPNAHC
ncbi:uncharacterized protein LOC143234933 [Tachypleus tridentatus]|uniref:uncharacterized protein LOC143234933 n=1 Tax=Tachypleus tridentatus TaxID=6853 RepID=UPI003FCF3C6E